MITKTKQYQHSISIFTLVYQDTDLLSLVYTIVVVIYLFGITWEIVICKLWYKTSCAIQTFVLVTLLAIILKACKKQKYYPYC